MTFPVLADIIPEQTRGFYSITNELVEGYNRLYLKHNDDVIMYDQCTRPIKNTYENNMKELKGNVLICGLGVGFCIFPIIDEVAITSITVVEQSQDVIDLISPYLPSVTFIKADATTYIPTVGYDSIFLDIWQKSQDVNKTIQLHRYQEYLNENGFINYLEF